MSAALSRILVVAAALLGGATACGIGASGSSDAPPAVAIARSNLEVLLEEVGVVEATRVVPITAPFRGMLIHLAETGQMVEVGQDVLVMENEAHITTLEDRLNDLKSIRSELEASIESLTIALRSGTLDVDFAESQLAYERARLEDTNNRMAETAVLLEQNVVPADDFREAEFRVSSTRLSTVTRDLDLRTEAINSETGRTSNLTTIDRHAVRGAQARRQIDLAQQRIAASRIQAPVTGMFLRTKRWDWGSQRMVEAKPGDSVREGQPIGEIPDLSTLILRSQIPEGDLHRVAVGQPVRITFDAYDGLRLNGRVTNIGKVAIAREASAAGVLVQAEGYSGQKVFEITIAFDAPDPRVKPGITAQVSIVLERHTDVLAVPIDAVRWADGHPVVTVVDAQGVATSRAVELGVRNGGRVVVRDGLREGEMVARDGAAAVRPGRSG
ncbi:MAG: HlyD family efflux transporter periplasmic adaptor subunit [Candidatus Sumerlaeia bacterium]|nr:HlyD family efflux transporter periplasmic adaptor subunit [Candidatus Sumerlaeia bacterium]